MFKVGRLLSGAGGFLGLAVTALLVLLMLAQQPALGQLVEVGEGGQLTPVQTTGQYAAGMLLTRLILVGGPALASIAALFAAMFANPGTRRLVGLISFGAALMILASGVIGGIAVSVLAFYLLPGMVTLLGAASFWVP